MGIIQGELVVRYARSLSRSRSSPVGSVDRASESYLILIRLLGCAVQRDRLPSSGLALAASSRVGCNFVTDKGQLGEHAPQRLAESGPIQTWGGPRASREVLYTVQKHTVTLLGYTFRSHL